MISMQDLIDMVHTEAHEGNNGDTCQDFGHELPTTQLAWIGIDWCRGYPDRLYSKKAKRRDQRRLDRTSRARTRKRAAELRRRR